MVTSGGSKVLASKLFKKGEISIQSPSAAAVVDCLGVEEDDVVLDVCAAPGTKTFQLANLLGNKGFHLCFRYITSKSSIRKKR